MGFDIEGIAPKTTEKTPFVEKIDNEGHPAFEVAVEQSVNQMLIDNHHAVPYFGQSKEEIKEQHLINRTKINL